MNNNSLKIPSQLETERLILRPYKEQDSSDFLCMLNNGNREYLKELLGDISQITDEIEIKHVLRELSDSWFAHEIFVLSFWEKKSMLYLGHIWIQPINWDLPHFEVGWFVEKNHQGLGFVTEAAIESIKFIFKYLNAHNIRVRVREHPPYHLKSKRIAEKCGFKKEGFLRDTVKLEDGTIFGETYFGLLREEFKF